MIETTSQTVVVTRLDELAATINREFQSAQKAASEAIRGWAAIGEALIEAREAVPDGGWYQWVEENLPFGPNTTRKYIRIYVYRLELEQRSEEEATLNVNEALQLLTGLPLASPRRSDQQPEEIKELARGMVRALGSGPSVIGQIAEEFGVHRDTVWGWIDPQQAKKFLAQHAKAKKRRVDARRALVRQERDNAVRRVGGDASHAYSQIRKTAALLDKLLGEPGDTETRESFRDALRHTHKAEDAIVKALRLS